jgi:hypothetical protein
VTLTGLEPATSPVPRRTRTLYPPLSYSVVTIFMAVCGGAAAEDRINPATTEQGDARARRFPPPWSMWCSRNATLTRCQLRPFTGHRISQISAMKYEHRAYGGQNARKDKPTTQRRNRCCIFGRLSHRRRNSRNRYFDSSQTRTIANVTVACGTPALGASSDCGSK